MGFPFNSVDQFQPASSTTKHPPQKVVRENKFDWPRERLVLWVVCHLEQKNNGGTILIETFISRNRARPREDSNRRSRLAVDAEEDGKDEEEIL